MKFINAIMILFIFSFSFCMSGEKNGQDPDQRREVIKKDRKLKFTIPDVRVKEGDELRFKLAGNTQAVIIIPNSDQLFDENDPDYINYEKGDWLGIKYLIIPLEGPPSEYLDINQDANPSPEEPKIYPYGVYYPELGEWAEGDSSPEIIVEP